MALHQDVPQKLEFLLGQWSTCPPLLGGDEVNGDLAVLYQLTSKLHPHVEVHQFVIRLERRIS